MKAYSAEIETTKQARFAVRSLLTKKWRIIKILNLMLI